MRTPQRPRDRPGRDAPGPLGARLAWFVALWVGSVVALGAVAYAIRLWLGLG